MNESFFAVAGKPVLHSLSPVIFRKAGLNYTRLCPVEPEDIFYLAINLDIKGINLTMPYKNTLLGSLEEVDPQTEKIGAANTIIHKNKKWKGYNTDIFGVYKTLKDTKFQNVLIIGAGNAAKAAVAAVIEKAEKIFIYNRTQDKAKNLKQLFNRRKISDVKRYELGKVFKQTELIISAVPELEEETLNILSRNIFEEHIILDAVYHRSKLEKIANIKRCRYISGIHWLINQAEESYRLFKGEDIPILSFPHKGEEVTNSPTLEEGKKRGRNFILTGFSGSGKSTIGKALAKMLNLGFIDTDDLIEQKTGESIENIFTKYGEDYFRQLEKKEISAFEGNKYIISTGGGMPVHSGKELMNLGYVIYLYTDLDISFLRTQNTSRPLMSMASREIKRIYDTRLPEYVKFSDMIINSNHPVEQVTENLYEEINRII